MSLCLKNISLSIIWSFLLMLPCVSYAQEYISLNINSSLSIAALLKDSIEINNFSSVKVQNDNSFKKVHPRLIAPAAFITYGIIAQESHPLKEIDHSTNHEVKEDIVHKMTYDNYLQFVPAASVYGLNLLGIKGQNDLKDVTVVMLTSHLIMGSTVLIMKNKINVMRPDETTDNSFPSGHTATSFAGAHILFREYIHKSRYIAYSGYIVSTATGTLRVLNKRHWVSDVVMGAGIGMLSVEASYLLLPGVNSVLYPNRGKQKSNLAIVPSVGNKQYGLGMAYTF